jgi:hypothetical protein
MMDIKNALKEGALKRVNREREYWETQAKTYQTKAEKAVKRAETATKQVSEAESTVLDYKIVQMLERLKAMGIELTATATTNPGTSYSQNIATGVFKDLPINCTVDMAAKGPTLEVGFSWDDKYYQRPRELQGKIVTMTYYKNLCVHNHYLNRAMGDQS